MVRHELDKENLPPALDVANGKASHLTPGRRRKTQTQYFDIGKVGRYAHIQPKSMTAHARTDHGAARPASHCPTKAFATNMASSQCLASSPRQCHPSAEATIHSQAKTCWCRRAQPQMSNKPSTRAEHPSCLLHAPQPQNTPTSVRQSACPLAERILQVNLPLLKIL